MATPIFESKNYLDNEREVAQRLASRRNLKLVKLRLKGLDYMLTDENGEGVCFLEIKCFKSNHDSYPTLPLNLLKYEKLKIHERLLPTFFVIKFADDVITYIDSREIDGKLKELKRKVVRPNAAHDNEVCIFINSNKFTKL